LDPKNPDYYRAIAACYGKLGNKAMAAKYNNYADSLGTGKNSPGRPAAEKIKITVFAGFTTVAMSKVNNDIDTLYSNAIAGGGTGQKEDLGSGFIIGAQGGYNVFPGLYAGPRMELIDVPTAKTTYSGSVFGMTYSGEADYSGSMFPVLVGASYYYPIQGQKITLSGDLYLGYGAAGVTLNQINTEFGTTLSVNPSYSGGAFVADIAVNGGYKLTDSITAGLTIGYRLANVSQMTANEDYSESGTVVIKKGDVLKDSNNDTMPVDFSGMIISVNGTYSF
ncbi:MAG: hypothetical protein ABSA34_03825, partial [Candidatus Goldiibacteriota bacterium]